MVDFGRSDTVPHVTTRKTHQRLLEFSFDTPKRLLQQYPGQSRHPAATPRLPFLTRSGHWERGKPIQLLVSPTEAGPVEFLGVAENRSTTTGLLDEAQVRSERLDIVWAQMARNHRHRRRCARMITLAPLFEPAPQVEIS